LGSPAKPCVLIKPVTHPKATLWVVSLIAEHMVLQMSPFLWKKGVSLNDNTAEKPD